MRGINGRCPIEGYPVDGGTSGGMSDEAFRLLTAERVLDFDIHRYPFRDIFQSLFDEEDLSMIHEHEYRTANGTVLAGNYGNRGSRNPVNKIWHDQSDSSGFYEVYHRFITECIAPTIGDPQGLVFQSRPTFRCHSPDGSTLGRPHTDSEYFHQPHEVNFWVPVCKVWGANTLWAESTPGEGDFHPFEIEYGQMVMFYGNQCHHYTVPNTSGKSRVSFDFRVIPMSRFDGDYEPSRDKKSGVQKFSV